MALFLSCLILVNVLVYLGTDWVYSARYDNTKPKYSSDQVFESQAREMKIINEHLYSKPGNVLVITCEAYNFVIDTYLTRPFYLVHSDELDFAQGDGDTRIIDLEKQYVRSPYPGYNYEDLKTADFLVTDGTLLPEPSSVSPILLEGVHSYFVFENKEPGRLVFCAQ